MIVIELKGLYNNVGFYIINSDNVWHFLVFGQDNLMLDKPIQLCYTILN